VSLGDKIVSRG